MIFPRRIVMTDTLARPVRNQRGQALVELAITVSTFVLLCMGTIEIGRIWLISSMITQAAREGARAGALTASSNRGTGSSLGLINSSTKNNIVDLVKSEIRSVLDAGTVNNALTVAVTQTPATGGPVDSATIPLVTVTVSGSVPYIFNVLGATQVTFDRAVSFRDEGR